MIDLSRVKLALSGAHLAEVIAAHDSVAHLLLSRIGIVCVVRGYFQQGSWFALGSFPINR